MEDPICLPDPTHREVCCLPEVHVRDITKEQPSLVQATDYQPLLVFLVGSKEILSRRLLDSCQESSRSSGPWDNWSRDLENTTCISVLSFSWNEGVRNRKIMKSNMWLRDWCDQQNFGCFDHSSVYTPSLLSTNRDLSSGVTRTCWESFKLDLKGYRDIKKNLTPVDNHHCICKKRKTKMSCRH